MKKLILIALFSVLVFSNCKSDDDDDESVTCETKITNATDALNAYIADTNVANCNAYKTALENSLGCYPNQETEDAAQTTLDNLVCE